MEYSRRGPLEIEMHTFLALHLMGLGGQVNETPLPCAGTWISPWLDYAVKEKWNVSCL